MRQAVYCADIGSIKQGNFGWAARRPDSSKLRSGTCIGEFVERISADLESDIPVALGFECPLFVPFPRRALELTSARRRCGGGKEPKPWSAGAGAITLAVGLTETTCILSRVRESLSPPPPLFLSWSRFRDSGSGLPLWEAFVTGRAKAEDHRGDAAVAVGAFEKCVSESEPRSYICEPSVFSLIAASALRAGWSSAASLIDQPCLVVFAEPPAP